MLSRPAADEFLLRLMIFSVMSLVELVGVGLDLAGAGLGLPGVGDGLDLAAVGPGLDLAVTGAGLDLVGIGVGLGLEQVWLVKIAPVGDAFFPTTIRLD